MKLINVQTLELEEFPEIKVPPYAILSHTWEDDEVTFEDMQGAFRPTHKAGFKKISFTAKQAHRDGLLHVWVDTCCINKKSSAELQEAINSMYRYYADASVCYVYLSDVLGGCPTLLPRSRETEEGAEWRAFFIKSRWFSRGWTLQELLAPTKLVFYGREWNLLGEKERLTESIAEATGIQESILTRTSRISSMSVAQRMSWAANRQTTRVEDRAYSLIGIFDVNMPMLYGEGTKAFTRLQEEIIKTTTDHSIFAWQFDDGSEADGSLLASSPSNFRSSQTIIPWGRPKAFAITNRGLEIALRTINLTTRYEETLAVLNCRYDNDFSGTLALRLRKLASGEEYHATRNRDLQNMRKDRGQPETVFRPPKDGGMISLNSRLAFLSNTWQNEPEEPTLLQINRIFYAEPSRFKFRLIPVAGETVLLSDFHPITQWDKRKWVMHAEDGGNARGAVAVKITSGTTYILCFGFDLQDTWQPAYGKGGMLFGIWGTVYPEGQSTPISERCTDLVARSRSYCKHFGGSCFNVGCPRFPDSILMYESPETDTLRATMTAEEIMGDTVFTIRLTARTGADMQDNSYGVRIGPRNAVIQSKDPVKAYQTTLLRHGNLSPLQHELHNSEAKARHQIWIWLSSELIVESVSIPQARMLSHHILLCCTSENECIGLVTLSSRRGDNFSLFFSIKPGNSKGDHHLRISVFANIIASSNLSATNETGLEATLRRMREKAPNETEIHSPSHRPHKATAVFLPDGQVPLGASIRSADRGIHRPAFVIEASIDKPHVFGDEYLNAIRELTACPCNLTTLEDFERILDGPRFVPEGAEAEPYPVVAYNDMSLSNQTNIVGYLHKAKEHFRREKRTILCELE